MCYKAFEKPSSILGTFSVGILEDVLDAFDISDWSNFNEIQAKVELLKSITRDGEQIQTRQPVLIESSPPSFVLPVTALATGRKNYAFDVLRNEYAIRLINEINPNVRTNESYEVYFTWIGLLKQLFKDPSLSLEEIKILNDIKNTLVARRDNELRKIKKLQKD